MGMPNPFAAYRISDGWAAHRARGSLGGIDWATPVGTPITAPNPGQVVYEAGNGSGGYIITLHLANSPGYKMQFLHCSSFNGGNRTVKEGELLGYTGGAAGAPGAGSSTGPHVHVHMVDPNGVREDPLPWFANSAPAPSGLSVDGDFGPSTKRALQSALGVAVDGDFGPNSTRALQGFLGIAQDGSWGPATTRALQGFLGVPADGSFGPQTVRALQASLNGGTFKKVAPVAPKPPTPPVVAPKPPTPPVTAPEPAETTVLEKPAEAVKPVVKPTTKPADKPAANKPNKETKPMTNVKPLPTEATHAGTDALGILIPNANGRKLAYALYGLSALIVSNIGVGIMAAGVQAPIWVIIASAVVGNLAVPFTTLAIANAPKIAK